MALFCHGPHALGSDCGNRDLVSSIESRGKTGQHMQPMRALPPEFFRCAKRLSPHIMIRRRYLCKCHRDTYINVIRTSRRHPQSENWPYRLLGRRAIDWVLKRISMLAATRSGCSASEEHVVLNGAGHATDHGGSMVEGPEQKKN